MKIRKATLDDIPQLVRLNCDETFSGLNYQEISQEDRWTDGLWWVDNELMNWYQTTLKEAGGDILVVVNSENKVVAELDYCQSWDKTFKFKGDRIHIIWILVDSYYRGQGLAKLLLDHLQETVTIPIWVEPEDIRSESLYRNRGEVIHTISNWRLDLPNLPDFLVDARMNYQEYPLSVIESFLNTHQLLIGRYYIPRYDYFQLLRSQPVAQFMWGNTDPASVFMFELGSTKVYAIMTQYPRIWVNPEYDESDLKLIFSAICLYIFELGFDSIYLQIYNGSGIEPMLVQHNFEQVIPADPVFQLT